MNRVEHLPTSRHNESSVRSAMFIGRATPNRVKLRRSGMCGNKGVMSPRWGWGFVGVGCYKHAAPLGLTVAKLETEIQQGMKELEGMLK
jgi:hypothetical protein